MFYQSECLTVNIVLVKNIFVHSVAKNAVYEFDVKLMRVKCRKMYTLRARPGDSSSIER